MEPFIISLYGSGIELCIGEIKKSYAEILLESVLKYPGFNFQQLWKANALSRQSVSNVYQADFVNENGCSVRVNSESNNILYSFALDNTIHESINLKRLSGFSSLESTEISVNNNKVNNKTDPADNLFTIIEPDQYKTYLLSYREKMGFFFQRLSTCKNFSINQFNFWYADLIYFGLKVYIHKVFHKNSDDFFSGKTWYINSEAKHAIIMDQTVYGYF